MFVRKTITFLEHGQPDISFWDPIDYHTMLYVLFATKIILFYLSVSFLSPHLQREHLSAKFRTCLIILTPHLTNHHLRQTDSDYKTGKKPRRVLEPLSTCQVYAGGLCARTKPWLASEKDKTFAVVLHGENEERHVGILNDQTKARDIYYFFAPSKSQWVTDIQNNIDILSRTGSDESDEIGSDSDDDQLGDELPRRARERHPIVDCLSLDEGKTVLQVGAGDLGLVAETCAVKTGAEGRVMLIDVSEVVSEQTESKNGALIKTGRLRIAPDASFVENASCDAVYCINSAYLNCWSHTPRRLLEILSKKLVENGICVCWISPCPDHEEEVTRVKMLLHSCFREITTVAVLLPRRGTCVSAVRKAM